jgi:large subunit ribosomal protein L23
MALFKKKTKESSFVKTSENKEVKKETKELAKTGLPQGKDPRFYKIIEKPIVTEKAVSLSGINQYVFKVFPKANKIEIKKAIEKLYDVKVKDMKIINTVAKKRQVGRFEGTRPGFKKTIVILKKGHTIQIT